MDVTTPIITTTATTTTPETETETPPTKLTDHHHHHNHQTHRHQSKVLSFTNGALKQHHHHHHSTTSSVVVYKECLKNHAATLGGHAVDGCGEFMPSPTTNPTDPTSLKCAACGCHRNFHRRDPDDGSTHIIEYHHHLPPPPPLQPPRVRSPNSVSPPPISSSYYPSSAPHMLLALSTGVAGKPDTHPMVNNTTTPINMGNRNEGSNNKKRFRTKFSVEQKEKMQIFAERLGWKMQKRDERLVEEFCNEIGVCRGVLKVWMHNNKHTFGKRDHVNSSSTSNPHNNNNNNNNNSSHNNHNNHHGCSAPVVTNGSSSSS